MPYKFLDDLTTADVAFEVTGSKLEEVFLAAAEATANTMVDCLESVARVVARDVSLECPELDLLLFNYLQELIYYKDAEALLLLPERIEIRESEDGFALRSTLKGEEIDVARHEQRVDVKAVTLHRFKLEKTSDGWRALVILDV